MILNYYKKNLQEMKIQFQNQILKILMKKK